MVRIKTVDTRTQQLILENVRSCYLVQDTKTVLIDSGFPTDRHSLLAGLAQLGLSPADLDYVALTHLHFDHAGGAGYLARENPRLKVLIHARGARHLIDPARLTESVKRAYGDRFHTIGSPWPVVEEQVRTIGTGDRIDLGGCRLEVYNTPGHAKHHVIFFDPATESVFSGDALGSRYPGLPNFVLSPPADYDKELAKTSIDLIEALNPKQINFTHCGPYRLEAKDAFFDTLKSEHERWTRTVAEIINQNNGLSTETIFEQFLDKLPQLKKYPEQFFSFSLSVKGILLYLQRNSTLE